METILEILKYILPSLVVFLTVYFLLKSYFEFKNKSELQDVRKKDHEVTLPLRLQAYERLVLLMERISPNQLIFRVKRADMTPAQFQSVLIQTIREEFEHNIAQQIYVSQESWNLVKTAREELIRSINTAFVSLDEKATSNDLAQKIIEEWAQQGQNTVQAAILYLKKEVQNLF